MKNNLCTTQLDIYTSELTTIQDVHFTPREIDIIACLISARGTNKIASFLTILPKTVRNHIHNIMIKAECNSRDGIIDFVEKSNKLSLLKVHYTNLLIKATFEKCIKDISKLKREERPECGIVECLSKESQKALGGLLEEHLKLAGVKVSLEKRKNCQSISELIQEVKEDKYVIFILEDEIEDNPSVPPAEDFVSKHCLFLLPHRENPSETLQGLKGSHFLDLAEQKNCYFLVLEILKRMLPHINLEANIAEFRRHYEILQNSENYNEHRPYAAQTDVKRIHIKLPFNLNLKRKARFSIAALFIVGVFGVGFIAFQEKGKKGVEHHTIEASIRSDLVMPTASVLLDRSELIKQLDNMFKGQNNIQTIAIIGPGGAGKTTLARQYAHQRKANVIWEVNAETNESLKSSFVDLAHSLAISVEDKKILSGIQDNDDPGQRDKQITQFVKERLRSQSNWFIIFDNVDTFTSIHEHFPKDSKTWGNGKVILTTRNNNIQNSEHVNDSIKIGELTEKQKLALFTQIMNQKNLSSNGDNRIKETQEFLEKLPPYPLDISVAAYYLKSTNITYPQYLDGLSKHNKDFNNMHESILKESGDYTKTRYGIIISSVQRLVDTQEDFRDLILMISLLDSQNIPIDLLKRYKGESIIDHFIYNLKKYSLILNEPLKSSFTGPTLSLHRSTQAIILAYLLKNSKSEENLKIISGFSNVFAEHLSSLVDKENCLKMKGIVQHCEKFLSHNVIGANHLREPIESELGIINYYLNDFIKARAILEKNIELSRLNSNSISRARALGTLGSIYRYLGKYKDSKERLEESLHIFEKVSINNLGAARSLSWLSVVYRFFGEYDKAIKALQQSIVTFNNLSENHPGVAWATARLGFLHRDLGENQKAKQYFEKALILFKKNAESHVVGGVNQTLVILGVLHKNLGQTEEAKQVFENCITVNIKDCKNSIWLARATSELGSIYRDQGDYQKSRHFFEKTLAIYKNDFSENYVWIAHSMVDLGIVHELLGHHEKAKLLIEEGLKTYKEHLPRNHFWFAKASGWLGKIYLELGDFAKAKTLIEHDLEIYKNNYPSHHVALAWCYKQLANVYAGLGEDAKSKSMLEQSKILALEIDSTN